MGQAGLCMGQVCAWDRGRSTHAARQPAARVWTLHAVTYLARFVGIIDFVFGCRKNEIPNKLLNGFQK